jgi:hypothetical protein
LIGVKHPDYLADELTPRQIDEWRIALMLEPAGFDALNYAQARITWALCGGKKPERDYLMRFELKQPATPETYREKADARYMRHNAGLALRGNN